MLITNTNVSIVASAQICCFLFALPIVFICQVNAVDLSPCIPDADSFYFPVPLTFFCQLLLMYFS